MITRISFVVLLIWIGTNPSLATESCPGEKDLNYFLKYHFPILSLTTYNKACSQITEADFNGDGKVDVAAVLTETEPTRKYANGQLWYRTYVLVMLGGELPYNKSQAIFVRTDGNKPKGFSVEAIASDTGSDLVLNLENYSHTRYKWSKDGFRVIEHSAD